MKNLFRVLAILSISLMATSCYYDEFPADTLVPIPENVSYKSDIQPLLDQNCVSCHKSGSTSPDLTTSQSYGALTTNSKYVVPNNAANSILFKSLNGVGAALMPTSGKLSATKIALVEKWINDGALNN